MYNSSLVIFSFFDCVELILSSYFKKKPLRFLSFLFFFPQISLWPLPVYLCLCPWKEKEERRIWNGLFCDYLLCRSLVFLLLLLGEGFVVCHCSMRCDLVLLVLLIEGVCEKYIREGFVVGGLFLKKGGFGFDFVCVATSTDRCAYQLVFENGGGPERLSTNCSHSLSSLSRAFEALSWSPNTVTDTRRPVCSWLILFVFCVCACL